MSKYNVSIVNKEFLSRRAQFLHDNKSDLFVILKDKIYPLHKIYLNEIGYFTRPDFGHEKVHIIDSDIDEKWFQSVLGYFYGNPLQYPRNWSLKNLLLVIEFLKIPKLNKLILQDINNNFDDYGFFFLMNVGYTFNIRWLKDRCEQQLTLMNFEQLNYNRYDLYQVDLATLQEIIKLHQLLKANQNIIGLRKQNLQRIINQYCKTNNIVNFNTALILQIIEQSVCLNQSELIDPSRRMQPQPDMANQASNLSKSSNSQSTSVPQNSDSEVYQLKLLNSTIEQKNHQLHLQIKTIKDEFIQSNKKIGGNKILNEIDEKFKKFQKVSKQQQTKYLNVMKEMEKLSPGTRNLFKSQLESQQQDTQFQVAKPASKQQCYKSVSPGASKKQGQIFSQIPQLSKDLDQ